MQTKQLSHPRYSIIVPARREEAYLPKLLDSVDVARIRYSGGPQCFEVIVSDNSSTDRTAQVALERGCLVCTVETRNIGAVRNAGACLAHGEILFFVDSDLQLHPESFNEAELALSDVRVVGGCMGARWDRRSFALAVTDILARLYEVARNRSLGGRGTTFCPRDAYQAVGGATVRTHMDLKMPGLLRS